ncbi:Transcription factor HES-2 [Manis javanica]|nr:Transcription factor HES-2 [Manis javanica]
MGLPRRAGHPAELRKSLKPLLEKRRRARINASLRQLKGLILPLLGREELPASSCPAEAPTPSDSYRDGYRACVARLARVLPAYRILEPALSARLLEHLRRRATQTYTAFQTISFLFSPIWEACEMPASRGSDATPGGKKNNV